MQTRQEVVNNLNTISIKKNTGMYAFLELISSKKTLEEIIYLVDTLKDEITADGLNAIIPQGPYRGSSILFLLTRLYRGNLPDYLYNKITEHGLNAVSSEECHRGESILFWLVQSEKGQRILSKGLHNKITPEGLNTISLAECYKGESILFWLIQSNIGQTILVKGLYNKITPDGLNTIITQGQNKGTSALFWLCNAIRTAYEDTESNCERLIADKSLQKKITQNGLNAIVPEGPNKGMSPLLLLSFAAGEKGQKILADNKILRAKITQEGLNAIEPKTGYSVLFKLASTKIGRKVLLQDTHLRQLIHQETLFSVVEVEQGIKTSAADFLISSTEGQKMMSIDANFKKKLLSHSSLAVQEKQFSLEKQPKSTDFSFFSNEKSSNQDKLINEDKKDNHPEKTKCVIF